jgi:putative acetyltransferase
MMPDPGGLRLGPLTDALWPEACDLWIAAWVRTMPHIDFEARRGWLDARRRDSLAAGVIWRAACAARGELLGFYCLDPASGEIDQVAVRVEAWGSGVASSLLDDAKALRPAGIALTVNQGNARAVAFYEKQGMRRGMAGVNAGGAPIWHYHWP